MRSICGFQNVKYYYEMKIYQLIVNVTAGIVVNSVLKCNEFKLAELTRI